MPGNPNPPQQVPDGSQARFRRKHNNPNIFYVLGLIRILLVVPANCSTPFWDPIAGKCICTASTCAFTDNSRPVGVRTLLSSLVIRKSDAVIVAQRRQPHWRRNWRGQPLRDSHCFQLPLRPLQRPGFCCALPRGWCRACPRARRDPRRHQRRRATVNANGPQETHDVHRNGPRAQTSPSARLARTN